MNSKMTRGLTAFGDVYMMSHLPEFKLNQKKDVRTYIFSSVLLRYYYLDGIDSRDYRSDIENRSSNAGAQNRFPGPFDGRHRSCDEILGSCSAGHRYNSKHNNNNRYCLWNRFIQTSERETNDRQKFRREGSVRKIKKNRRKDGWKSPLIEEQTPPHGVEAILSGTNRYTVVPPP